VVKNITKYLKKIYSKSSQNYNFCKSLENIYAKELIFIIFLIFI